MRNRKSLFGRGQKRASVVATVLFVALACLVGYGAIRWMGGAVVRYLSVPAEDVPQSVGTQPVETPFAPPQQEQPQPTEISMPIQSVETGENPSEEPAAESKQTPEPPDRETEPLQETGAWRETVQYRAAFTEDRMDVVLLLTDAEDHAQTICLLAVREDSLALVAIPGNVLRENGRTLDSYAAEDAVDALSSLLQLEINRFIRLPRTEFAAAIKLLGPLEVGGREMDGDAAEEYLCEAEAAPLVYAERFSHILRALPKTMRSLSLWQLLCLKSVLSDVVKSNLSEEDGWMLCHAVRNAEQLPIEEITLPMESDLVAGMRVYRMNSELTEPILEKLYKSFKKTS